MPDRLTCERLGAVKTCPSLSSRAYAGMCNAVHLMPMRRVRPDIAPLLAGLAAAVCLVLRRLVAHGTTPSNAPRIVH